MSFENMSKMDNSIVAFFSKWVGNPNIQNKYIKKKNPPK